MSPRRLVFDVGVSCIRLSRRMAEPESYFRAEVHPALRPILVELARQMPPDPLQFVSNALIAHSVRNRLAGNTTAKISYHPTPLPRGVDKAVPSRPWSAAVPQRLETQLIHNAKLDIGACPPTERSRTARCCAGALTCRDCRCDESISPENWCAPAQTYRSPRLSKVPRIVCTRP